MQVDVALQMNRARQERARRHDHASAPGAIAGRDGLLKSLRAILHTVADRAVACHVEIASGKSRRLDPGENLLHLGPGFFRRWSLPERRLYCCRDPTAVQ